MRVSIRMGNDRGLEGIFTRMDATILGFIKMVKKVVKARCIMPMGVSISTGSGN
jgi:hypothetical protein